MLRNLTIRYTKVFSSLSFPFATRSPTLLSLLGEQLTSTARWKIVFRSAVTSTSTKLNDGWAAYQTEWNALKSFTTAITSKGWSSSQATFTLGQSTMGRRPVFLKCVSRRQIPKRLRVAAQPPRKGFGAKGLIDQVRTVAYDSTSDADGAAKVRTCRTR